MPAQPSGGPIRIVVADDHPSVRENLRYLLNAEPGLHVVAVAADGEEAFAMAWGHRPDVLVLDQDMPLLDGLGVLARCRSVDLDVAVVMYTTEADVCERAYAAGASACVTKDEPPSALLAAIRSARAHWALRDRRAPAAVAEAAPSGGPPIDAAALTDAIARKRIEVWLQPIVELGSAALSRYEVLARWRDPDRGWIAPTRFVRLAETSGIVTPLTLAVVRGAARHLAAVRRTKSEARLSINLSVASLLDPTFFDQLTAALADASCDPAAIGIEITESILMQEPASTAGALGRLRALGMRIEVDDFGTGYSSLGRLVDLPIDAVKIDRRFVGAMTRDHRSEAIVRACISLSHDLALEAVAEGVEDRETWDLLKALGCDSVQGYFVGAPMPPPEIDQWLAGWRTRALAADRHVAGPRAGDGAAAQVLVVDDEPAIVAMIRDVLEDAGFRVLTAANGLEALRALEHERPSVVLLDMQMPILDGAAFTRVLRERGLEIPIIVMTAGTSAARWAQELPADGFLSKPFDIDGLLGVANRYAARN